MRFAVSVPQPEFWLVLREGELGAYVATLPPSFSKANV